ncbi:uncharacterized protein JCM6883_007107 [Sporobolomyces salmoneus]|uniref:uncharacterized protein n=1 Tax=Sporobolomyces salmoneus TaxID=183962 RepID=UPI0031810CC0
MHSSATALAALALVQGSLAATREYWHNITYTTSNPDGEFEKPYTVGTNGTWPPPIVEVNYNDTLIVHAINGLGSGHSTSIHHHGIFFNGSAYYDGAPSATECGIPPGETLSYHVPVDRQWGTYWWHSHTGPHYQDGLRAPLIIHAQKEAYDYDEEYTIILSDWYHARAEKEIKKFLSKYNPTGAEPVPDSLLIYAAQGSQYLPSNENVAFNENLSIPFEAGKTYRLRVINTGIFSMNNFWIDGHEMRIIEADGTDIEEFPVDYLTLAVAQRYSVLVTAKNESNSNYLIHANFDTRMFDTVPDDLVVNYTSTISYGSNLPLAPSETRPFPMNPNPDYLMVPLIVEPQFVPDRQIELDVYFDVFDDGTNRAAMLDNVTWVPPKTPSLMTMLSMGQEAMTESVYGPQTAPIVLEKNEVIDLLVINFDGNGHPFHLHGHKFQITRFAVDVTSDDPALNPPYTYDNPNPMTRDTVVVPPGGAVNIAFRADNPGAWLFHCHIQWHMEAGLAVVFMEDPLGAQQTLTLPQRIVDQCNMQGINPYGNAAGKLSLTDLRGAPDGPRDQAHITGWQVDSPPSSSSISSSSSSKTSKALKASKTSKARKSSKAPTSTASVPRSSSDLVNDQTVTVRKYKRSDGSSRDEENRTRKAKGALAGCVITAVLGMLTVVWYAVGGQLDIEELEREVQRKLDEKDKAGGGLLKRGFNLLTGKGKRVEL